MAVIKGGAFVSEPNSSMMLKSPGNHPRPLRAAARRFYRYWDRRRAATPVRPSFELKRAIPSRSVESVGGAGARPKRPSTSANGQLASVPYSLASELSSVRPCDATHSKICPYP